MGSGRLGAGGNPEWRGQGVAAGGLDVCVACVRVYIYICIFFKEDNKYF